MQRSVCIMLLTGSGHPRIEVMEYIQREIISLLHAQIPASYFSVSNCSMIPHARNWGVTKFLEETEATDLVMIDDDNFPEDGTIAKLLSYDADVIGVPCRSREEALTWPVRWLTDGSPIRKAENGLIEVECVGTGIIRISRSALLALIQANPLNWYHEKRALSGKLYALFRYEFRDNMLFGEDVAFCHDWRAIGGKVWITPDIETKHIGVKAYPGKPSEWLKGAATKMSVNRDPVTVENEFAAPKAPAVAVKSDAPQIILTVPTRGRPDLVVQTVWSLLENAALATTRIVVGLDSDEPVIHLPEEFPATGRLTFITALREDSLGAKYNRCAAVFPKGDVFVLGCDDAAFDEGWDEKILAAAQSFSDGIGTVFFGADPQVLQPGIAITRGQVERQGYFMTDLFPFWWHDTWADEIARMTGRFKDIGTSIKCEFTGPLKASRGCRDVEFWARLFDETRHLRWETAAKIGGITAAEARELFAMFERRNSKLRDPLEAKRIEKLYSFDAPDDERYRRIKAKAEKMMMELAEVA